MEGPSLVIATEELAPFFNKKPSRVEGSANIDWEKLSRQKFIKASSWGKHLILSFSRTTFRIHFLMFGSYRIDDPRENRVPKMVLTFKDHTVYFYSCAIKEIPQNFEEDYDWSVDLMSDEWDHKKAKKHLLEKPQRMVCDVLMDQEIFSGLGNIIKNEVLFRLKLHPEIKVQDLAAKTFNLLVKEARTYSLQFYEWKKANVLKKNWLVFRKKSCPVCGSKITKKPTGVLKRISHFCPRCQRLTKS